MCKFVIAWVGTCKEENVKGSNYCQKHIETTCVHCGEQATHDTDTTFMGMGAGNNICDQPRCKEMERDRSAYFAEKNSFFKVNVVPKTYDEKYYENFEFHAKYRKKYYETYGLEEDLIIASLCSSVLERATPENVLEVALEVFSGTFSNPNVQKFAKKEIESAEAFQKIKQL